MEIKKLATHFLKMAIAKKASDLLILPTLIGFKPILRSVNRTSYLSSLDLKQGQELINYLKFAAQMDIAEHRRPQVGALTFEFGPNCYYLRLSSVGNYRGNESLVVRIIYSPVANHFFYPEQLQRLTELTKKRGLILTSGPTGSGKTATMYELARRTGQDKVVMTIEDPVEIQEEHFFQTQVNLAAGTTYPTLLKAALRQRPDILIIGEIRDEETAQMATNAALSGHLVLATVHAKSSLQTISRLEGLGISRIVLRNCLTAISYQRLLPVFKQNQVSCLFDLIFGTELATALLEKGQDDFVGWHDLLRQLRKRGKIDEETFQTYQAG